VVVDDAGFFTAGLTDPLSLEKLVDGDLIRIGAELRKVKQVDYTTNTLTLSVAISCSAGEPVNLNFTGSGPDIGYRDYDGDGVIDARDNCPTIASTNLNDQDDDGIGDICDPGTPGVPALPLLGQLFGAALLLGSSAVALRRFTPGRGLPDTR
jgi:hypothetical protein